MERSVQNLFDKTYCSNKYCTVAVQLVTITEKEKEKKREYEISSCLNCVGMSLHEIYELHHCFTAFLSDQTTV